MGERKPIEESQLGASLSRLKSQKCKLFVLEYPKDHNGKEAAIRAGCTEKSAKNQACKWLKRKDVKAIIGKVERQDVEKLELDRHEVLRQLWYCLSRKATDFIQEDGSVRPVHEMSDRAQSVIDGFEVDEKIDPETGEITSRKTKIKVSSKLGAIEQAAKHLGLFAPDKVDVSMAALQEVFANLQRAPSLGPAEERLALEEHRLELEEESNG